MVGHWLSKAKNIFGSFSRPVPASLVKFPDERQITSNGEQVSHSLSAGRSIELQRQDRRGISNAAGKSEQCHY
jgi:hypothetical protein